MHNSYLPPSVSLRVLRALCGWPRHLSSHPLWLPAHPLVVDQVKPTVVDDGAAVLVTDLVGDHVLSEVDAVQRLVLDEQDGVHLAADEAQLDGVDDAGVGDEGGEGGGGAEGGE